MNHLNITKLFTQYLDQDPEILRLVQTSGAFDTSPIHWTFTLPELHRFISTTDPSFKAVDYVEFRSLLFSSPIQQTLQSHQAQIVIAKNQFNVNLSSYRLQPIDTLERKSIAKNQN